MKLFWITFRDCQKRHRPFLGVTIVEAYNAKDAIRRINDLHIHPGGEQLTVEFKEEEAGAENMARIRSLKDRLLSKHDLAEIGINY